MPERAAEPKRPTPSDQTPASPARRTAKSTESMRLRACIYRQFFPLALAFWGICQHDEYHRSSAAIRAYSRTSQAHSIAFQDPQPHIAHGGNQNRDENRRKSSGQNKFRNFVSIKNASCCVLRQSSAGRAAPQKIPPGPRQNSEQDNMEQKPNPRRQTPSASCPCAA